MSTSGRQYLRVWDLVLFLPRPCLHLYNGETEEELLQNAKKHARTL
jgi:hypothetical protein